MDYFIVIIAILCKLSHVIIGFISDIARNSSDPAQHDDVCAGPRANDVAPDDPNHSISGVNMQRKPTSSYSSLIVSSHD